MTRPAPALLITHLPNPGLGLWQEVLDEHGLTFEHRNLFANTLPTDLDGFSAIISLGGQMSATKLSDFPFLVNELALLGAALTRDTPVFGLCLGAQLLALAAGGVVAAMPHRCIDWPGLEMTAAAADDPLFAECPTRVPILKWHADGIDVTSHPAITLLATTRTPGCAVFRAGACAWGSQMHLEADETMLFERWLPDPIEISALLSAGLDPGVFAARSRELLPGQIAAMRPVLSRFAAYVTRREAAPRTRELPGSS
jgi:GMP synthase-like glutamine amidotransferase